MKTIATYSIKGGVGKTTSAVNLAFEAARSGYRVLLWDLDPQGAATYCYRVAPGVKGGAERLVGKGGELERHVRSTDVTGLDVVPADLSFRHLDRYLDAAKRPTKRLARLLDELDDRYDLVMLDCPPGATLSTESVFFAVDALLVPTVPSPLAARTLAQLVEFLTTTKGAPIVLPFLSMVDRRRRGHRELAEALMTGEPGFLRTVIADLAVIEQMGSHRSPVGAFAGRSPAAAAYRALWSEVAQALWSSDPEN